MAEKSTPKQEIFLWEGTDRRGDKVKGEMLGQTMVMVKAELRRQGVTPLKVKRKPKPLFGGSGKKTSKGKIAPKDISIFSRQMATMMSAGVPLVQSFEIVGKGSDNPAMRDLVLAIKSEVEGGGNLAQAFASHPKYFDELTCNLIHAGEQAGILETMLDKVATYKEKTEAIKAKVKKAMIYPVAIIFVALTITIGLLIFVIPQFQSLFQGFGADLPALTMMVINASEMMQAYWYLVVGGIAGFVFTLKYLNNTSQNFRDNVDRLVLKLPIFGMILTKAAIARFARTLSTMFAAGVPLVEAMDSVAGAVGNVVYREALLKMRDEISTGTSLTDSMQRTDVFPNMVIQMTSIGEEAGSLDSMLAKVADFYEEEVDNAVDAMSSLMEPVIMVVLGGLVSIIVIAMYLPIFKMGEVV